MQKKSSKKITKKSEPEEEQKKSVTSNRAEALEFAKSLTKQGIGGYLKKKIDFIPTGSFLINRAIGDGSMTDAPGGYPRGYVTEIFGDESCGKTTLAFHAVLQVQQNKGITIYADFEHSLRAQYSYMKNLGIDVDPPHFIHMTPKSFEEGAQAIGKALITLSPDLIVVDTLTAMLPKANYEAEASEDIQIGRHAKLTSNFLNWITKYLEKKNCALLLLNQLRSNIKQSKYDPGPMEVSSGGKAPRFYSILRLQLKPGQKEEVANKNRITGIDEKKVISQTIKITVVKNKLDIPFKSVPIHITFGQGIDNIRSIVAAAEAKKIIKKEGAGWFTWKDPSEKYTIKAQGIQNFKKQLEENPDALNALSNLIIPTQDYSEMKRIRDDLEARIDSLSDDDKEELKRLQAMTGDDESSKTVPVDEEQAADLEDLDKLTEELKSLGDTSEGTEN
jgi:recombination protein RecA